MKIYLDLLPEDRKEKIRKSRLFKIIIFQELRFMLPAVFFSVMLFFINLSVKMQAESLEKYYAAESSQEFFRDLKIYEKKFNEINAVIETVSVMEEKHLRWSNAFLELSEIFSDKVYLNSLTTKDYTLSVTGKAKTREDLIALQEKMRSSKCFLNANIPLSNLVSREDVIFQMEFEVNRDCLKQNP